MDNNMTDSRTNSGNNTFAIGGVSFSADIFFVKESSVLLLRDVLTFVLKMTTFANPYYVI